MIRKTLGAVLLFVLLCATALAQDNISAHSYKPGPATPQAVTTAAAQAPVDSVGYNWLQVQVVGTYAGLNFEGHIRPTTSGTYSAVEMFRRGNCVMELSSGALTDTNRVWYVHVGANPQFRINVTALTSGTANFTLTPFAGPGTPCIAANLPNPLKGSLDGLRLQNASDVDVVTATTTPGASDLGLVTRPIPSGTQTIQGSVAHDGVDANNPISMGLNARSFGSPPTAVAEADRARAVGTREGVQFVLPYHPGMLTTEWAWSTAQTNTAVITVSAGTRIVVTGFDVGIDQAATVGHLIRCGFGATTLSTAPADGATATGIFLSHKGLVPGGGKNSVPGMMAFGADGEDVRCTTTFSSGSAGIGTLVIHYFLTAN